MSVRIFIPEDVVVDDEIPEPAVGVEIPSMGVRLSWMWTPDGRDESFEGVVVWSRADESNDLFEAVFATSTFKALTQEAATDRLPQVGERATQRGTLSCIRSYEFDDFELPDVRQGWRVTALIARDRHGYLIEAEPMH